METRRQLQVVASSPTGRTHFAGETPQDRMRAARNRGFVKRIRQKKACCAHGSREKMRRFFDSIERAASGCCHIVNVYVRPGPELLDEFALVLPKRVSR